MHGSPAPSAPDPVSGYKSRLGIRMFIFYAIVYAGFVLINSFAPKLMGAVVMGQTFAVVYGFGLIVLALILALVYNSLCGRAEDRARAETDDSTVEVFE
ncbi:MAG: DUF485 domain-containing protein [Anaerolineae bacterium]|nr:DUF485 domain-containing protein [Anaerolineae bacterium]